MKRPPSRSASTSGSTQRLAATMGAFMGAAALMSLVAAPAGAAMSYTPIVFRQVSGTRPFIPVQLNGKRLLLMVHANAKLYVMTTHENAASLRLGVLGKTSNYGITDDGHVSTLGRTSATLASLRVGDREARDRKLSVFEIPQTPPTDGMLGMDWLRDQRVIVDYDAYRVGLPSAPVDAQAEDAKLIARGYISHKMIWDPDTKSYYVMGSVNGTPARLGVSTVGENALDSVFAGTASIALGPVVDQNGGPRGAVVDVRITKHPVSITLDGQPCLSAQAWAWDLYAYSSEARPVTPHQDGYLGADFMLANQAVIDFGTETLFVSKAQQ